MADEKIRSFLAIQLDQTVVQRVSDVVSKLQSKHPHFRFILPNQWHLTLHFFGSISSPDLNRLSTGFSDCFSHIPSFSILVKGFGSFPNERQSNIIWIGIGGETGLLINLKETLDLKLSELKFPVETRAFYPHITIARSKTPQYCRFSEDEKNFEFGVSRVRKVTLYKSELTPQGPVHTSLGVFDLLNS